jgi:SAM-dependent methyltransferase
LHPPDRADAETIDEALARAGYTDAALARCLGLDPRLLASEQAVREAVEPVADPTLAQCLAGLFLAGLALPTRILVEQATPDEIAAFRRTGLICDSHEFDEPAVYAPVRLEPVTVNGAERPCFVVTDRTTNPRGGSIRPLFHDYVFSTNNPLTRHFVSLLPHSSGGTVLDLGTGSGIAAIVAAAWAERVVGVDILERARQFANFSAALNARPNVEFHQGDLFAPIAGARFDWIVAHPPYMPTIAPTAAFRDGGARGDELVQRIVEGAPAHLEPGGTLLVVLLAADVVDAPFETRVREWLGPTRDAFDLIFAVREERPNAEVAERVARVTDRQPAEWLTHFESERIAKFSYGALAVRAAVTDGRPLDRRCRLAPDATFDAFERAFAARQRVRAAGSGEGMGRARPRALEGASLQVRHEVREGRLQPTAFALSTRGAAGPFPHDELVSLGTASLFAHCDGTRSIDELWTFMTTTERLSADTTVAQLRDETLHLYEHGLVELDES